MPHDKNGFAASKMTKKEKNEDYDDCRAGEKEEEEKCHCRSNPSSVPLLRGRGRKDAGAGAVGGAAGGEANRRCRGGENRRPSAASLSSSSSMSSSRSSYGSTSSSSTADRCAASRTTATMTAAKATISAAKPMPTNGRRPMTTISTPTKTAVGATTLPRKSLATGDATAATTAMAESASRYVYILAGCAALNSCNLGFDIGVNTDAALLIRQTMFLTDVQVELFMGSINLFAIIGALITSPVTSTFGLRGSFVASALFFVLGLLLQLTSRTFASLMIGRVFVGLGVGFGFAVGPMFISEVSPKLHRGYFVSWAEIGTNVGILLGFATGFLSYIFPPEVAWRVMFAAGLVMPTVMMVLLASGVMSESPRWLVQKGRYDEAKAVLERLYPEGHDVESELYDIRDAIEEESHSNRRVGWNMLLFPTPAVRRMLLVGFGTAIGQQLSGIDAIQYYLVFILEESGITNRLQQAKYLTALGILKLSCLFIAGPLFDKYGRRPLLFVSVIGMAVANFIIASTFHSDEDDDSNGSGTILFGLASYLAFFSLGIGPLAWVIPSEIFSTTIRAKAVSMTTFVNRLTATFVSSSMLSIANATSWGGYFQLLGFVCIFIFLFFYWYLPETKGRCLEDMGRYFAEITNDSSLLRLGEATEDECSSDGDEGRSSDEECAIEVR